MRDDGYDPRMEDSWMGGDPPSQRKPRGWWRVQFILLGLWALLVWLCWPLGVWRICSVAIVVVLIGGTAAMNHEYRHGRRG